jgi:fumarate reductase subunit C
MTTRSWWDSSATFRQCTLEKVTFIVLNQVDLILTLVAIHLGFDELNPLVNFLLDVPVLLVIFKLVLPVAIAWLIPGRLLWPSIGLLALVAIWNLKELIAFLI